MLASVEGTDQHLFLSSAVGEALGEIGEPAIEQLMTMLKDENSLLSLFAVEAVKRIGEPAVPAVIRDLNNLSLFALQALVPWLGDMQAVEAITDHKTT